jgi:hypothetical protein
MAEGIVRKISKADKNAVEIVSRFDLICEPPSNVYLPENQ